MDSSIISRPRLADDGFRVAYDDDDTYVIYRPDFSYPLSFQRDRGDAELDICPNVAEIFCYHIFQR